MRVATNGKLLLRRCRLVVGLGALCAVAVPAHAEPSAAEALFREGRQLLVAGEIAAACAKLEQSQTLEPSPGTLMNLAYCHAQLGKTASAWLGFLSAERQALAQGQSERAREARRQAVALEPALSHLTVRVTAPPPGLVVRIGQQTLPAASLAAPQPVDPGHHTVRVAAPGHQAYRATVDITGPGERVLEVPALVPETRPPAPGLRRREPSRSKLARREPHRLRSASRAARPPALPASFWVSGATAIAAAGAASVLGVLSLSDYARAEDRCPTAPRDCSDEALRLEDRAHVQANAANVAWAVAAVSAALAAYVFFDAKPAPQAARITSFRRSSH